MAKKYNLEIIAPARLEIHEIARLHMELVGPKSARRITDSIKNSIGELISHPFMGTVFSDSLLRLEGYRRLICGNYLCIYRLIGNTVFIYHVVDDRTNYQLILSNLLDI